MFCETCNDCPCVVTAAGILTCPVCMAMAATVEDDIADAPTLVPSGSAFRAIATSAEVAAEIERWVNGPEMPKFPDAEWLGRSNGNMTVLRHAKANCDERCKRMQERIGQLLDEIEQLKRSNNAYAIANDTLREQLAEVAN